MGKSGRRYEETIRNINNILKGTTMIKIKKQIIRKAGCRGGKGGCAPTSNPFQTIYAPAFQNFQKQLFLRTKSF